MSTFESAAPHAAQSRRRRRFHLFSAMLGAVLSLSYAMPMAAQVATPDSDKPIVAVLYFTNGALLNDADYSVLSKGLAEMMIADLARNPNIRVVERDRVQALYEEQNLSASGRVDESTVVRMGHMLGAAHVLIGAFVIDLKRQVRITVRAVNTETGEHDYVESIDGKSDDILQVISELGAKINDGLKLPARTAAANDHSQAGAKNPNQFKAMLLLSRAIEEQDKKNVSGAVALYKQAIDANPDFDRAKVRLASLERGTPEH